MSATVDLSANTLADFLRARRRLVTPEEVGLEVGSTRRVEGLRREEVASLAGISIAYYVRLEQGHDRHPSEDVLRALARALKLGPEAAAHLQGITRPPLVAEPGREFEPVGDQVKRLVAAQHAPAYVLGAALDVLASNQEARKMHFSFQPGRNVVEDVFLSRQAQDGYAHPGVVQREVVASLRKSTSEGSPSRRVAEVVTDLSRRSSHFHHLWRRHEVASKHDSTKTFVLPDSGAVTLAYVALQVMGAPGQQMVVYLPAGTGAAAPLEPSIATVAEAGEAQR